MQFGKNQTPVTADEVCARQQSELRSGLDRDSKTAYCDSEGA
jgi:hypothetical protein